MNPFERNTDGKSMKKSQQEKISAFLKYASPIFRQYYRLLKNGLNNPSPVAGKSFIILCPDSSR
jgi:hypothetical protein